MSFSSEQKELLLKQNIKSRCCRRALLEGMVASRGVVQDGFINLSVSTEDIAKFASDLIFELYSKEASFVHQSGGGRRKVLSFESHSLHNYVDSMDNGPITYSSKCSDCLSAFLKGVFLASGRISDPERLYMLEFSFARNINKFLDFFSENGLKPRVSEKVKETVVYFRNSNDIEMFFALAGMNNTAFSLMNTKIKREIINNVQRIANCETSNIDKAVSASMTQIAVIDELIKKGLLSQLPDELQLTALARVEHRDLSLSQLAAVITPPISKPGLSHRLKKIMELANDLLIK